MDKYTFSTFDVSNDRMRRLLAGNSRNMFRLLDIRDEREGIFAGLNSKKMFGPAYHWYVTCSGERTPDNGVEADEILTFSVYRVHHGLKMVAMAVRSTADNTLEERRMIHASLIEHIRVMSKISWVEGGEETECVFRYALGVHGYLLPYKLRFNGIYKELCTETGRHYKEYSRFDYDDELESRNFIDDDFFDNNFIDTEDPYYFRKLYKGQPSVLLYAYGTIDVPAEMCNICVCEEFGFPVHITELSSTIDHLSLIQGIEAYDTARDYYDTDRHMRFYSDDELLRVTDRKLHKETDMKVIERMYQLDRSRLTKKQFRLLEEEMFRTILIDREDIRRLLDHIQVKDRCDPDRLMHRYKGRYVFSNEKLRYYVMDVIRALTIDDLISDEAQTGYFHLGCNVIDFVHHEEITFFDGSRLSDVELRMRINLPGYDNYREFDDVDVLIELPQEFFKEILVDYEIVS